MNKSNRKSERHKLTWTKPITEDILNRVNSIDSCASREPVDELLKFLLRHVIWYLPYTHGKGASHIGA